MEKREGGARLAHLESARDTLRGAAKRLAIGICFGLCAYFAGLAELPFGARPFGVALLAASSGETVFVYVGLLLSAFLRLEIDEAIIYFAVYSALLLLRVFFWVFVELRGANKERSVAQDKGIRQKMGVFNEKVGARTLNSSVFGFALGAAVLFSGGLLYYDLFGLLIITLLSPLSTFLLCGYIEGRGKIADANVKASRGVEMIAEKYGLWYALGFFTLCAIAVFGAREVSVYGVSVSVAFALIMTFYVTCRYGVGYGSLGGLAVGLCYSPMISPIFAISALCMGILSRFSVALACFVSCFASCAWAFYVMGISALLGVFGGILSACLLYSVIYKAFFANVEKGVGQVSVTKGAESEKTNFVACRALSENALDGVKLYEMNERASTISDGLYRFSLFLDEINSDKKYNFNAKSDSEKYNEIYNDNVFGDIGAPEYRALSVLLEKNMKNEVNEYSTDRELSLRLCKILTDMRLEIFGVLVYGVRKKTIYIKGNEREILLENAKMIAEAIAPLLPFLIDFDDLDVRREGERGGALFIFEREKNSVSVVKRRVNARGEEVCGDSVAVFRNKSNRFFALLSDGMGSGSAANAISGVAVGFLGNMLSTGRLCEELVDMLNGFLCGKFQKSMTECSATLDLLELDLMNGHAVVYKCGAAPSYVYRRGRLFKLRSDSMPIGILNDVDLKKYDLELTRGDVIVMVSDGVTGEGGECPWLFDLLAQNLPSRGLERTSDLIVKYATAKGSGDDITVVLVRVE